MKNILFLLLISIFSINAFSQDKLSGSDSFYILKFNNIEDAKKCVDLFYEEGIHKNIIEKDNEFYIEIEEDEIKMKSVNHNGYILPRKWIKKHLEYFEVMTIGESSIGDGFIN